MDKEKAKELAKSISSKPWLYKPVIKVLNLIGNIMGFLMIPIKWGKDKLWERRR